MRLRFVIRRLSDGKQVEWFESREVPENRTRQEYLDAEHFMWSDGNYSCDCNRQLFFERQLGTADENRTYPCSHLGENRFHVLVVDEDARWAVFSEGRMLP